MDCSTPGLPVHRQLPEFTQTHQGIPITSDHKYGQTQSIQNFPLISLLSHPHSFSAGFIISWLQIEVLVAKLITELISECPTGDYAQPIQETGRSTVCHTLS